jgi:hypothetical protein
MSCPVVLRLIAILILIADIAPSGGCRDVSAGAHPDETARDR